MINFGNYLNVLNTFFALSLSSFDPKKTSFAISYAKLIYCMALLGFIPITYPNIVRILRENMLKGSGNQLSKLLASFQSTFIYILNSSLLLYKLINCKNDVSRKNQYIHFKVNFNNYLKNAKLKKGRDNRLFLLVTSSLIIFALQAISLIIVTLRVLHRPIHGFQYIVVHWFYYFQILSSGNIFLERILQFQFMLSSINRTLKENLDISRHKIEYRSKAYQMTVFCKISDNLNNLEELNSKIYSFIRELIQYDAFIMNISLLQKVLEIIVPIFFQFVSRFLSNEHYHTEPLFIVFGLIYMICNCCSLLIYITVCQNTENEMSTTAKILHEFPVHKTDDRLKESINRFSLQILQEKRPISVCGMFNVDNTLLYSMISSMTSYLILLVQFQLQGVGSSKG
uniref:Gustatory receptor n=1 Tax=Phlebotomus papatasi TaxID=29031 RepID=A0A3F2ZEQ9_PHLPP